MFAARAGWAGLVALLWVCVAAAGPVAVEDDRGRTIELERPATRIISLAPHLTELLYAAGAGDRLVGAVSYSDYPPPARALPRVGDASHVDMERILDLEPDLIVAWKSGNTAGDVDHLERLGLTVHVSAGASLAQIPGQLERLGRLAGTARTAGRAAEHYRRRLAALRARYGGRTPVKVFYQIWDRPLMTVNGQHFIGDAIDLCGGRNPFAGLDALAPTVSREAVIAADPLAIVANDAGGSGGDVLADWRQWPAVRAVRRGHLFTIPSDLIARPTPRVLEGVERLCEALEEARGENR